MTQQASKKCLDSPAAKGKIFTKKNEHKTLEVMLGQARLDTRNTTVQGMSPKSGKVQFLVFPRARFGQKKFINAHCLKKSLIVTAIIKLVQQ